MNLYCDYEEDEGIQSEISIYESRKVVELQGVPYQIRPRQWF